MSKRAVLLVNLGSPESAAVPDVRRYLEEFLGDERVIDRPRQPFRSILFNGIIIPRRAPKSAHAYEQVWTKDGSPLIVTSKSVQAKLAARLGATTPVYLAMRYGNPSIASVIGRIAADGPANRVHVAVSARRPVEVDAALGAVAAGRAARLGCHQFSFTNTRLPAMKWLWAPLAR
jgi:ferrochelatase